MDRSKIVEVESKTERSDICSRILKALPGWFGNLQAVKDYTKKVADMPFYACCFGGTAVGFAAIKVHNPDTAELCVMGVIKEYQRMGIGKMLVEECIAYCRRHNHSFLTVKTLADLSPDEGYARTRAFYRASGFRPLEVFTEIWDEKNPCLFMVMTTETPEIEYRPIIKEDLTSNLLAHFNRYQELRRYYAKENGGLALMDCDFTEQWDESKKQDIINKDFAELLLHGGTISGAFHKGKLIGFGCVDGSAIGSEGQYLQLIYLHVSWGYRNMGIGGRLFHLCAKAAKEAGAKKLFISAASYYETQCFYRKIGCVMAREQVKHLCDIDPYDIEMEYAL